MTDKEKKDLEETINFIADKVINVNIQFHDFKEKVLNGYYIGKEKECLLEVGYFFRVNVFLLKTQEKINAFMNDKIIPKVENINGVPTVNT